MDSVNEVPDLLTTEKYEFLFEEGDTKLETQEDQEKDDSSEKMRAIIAEHLNDSYNKTKVYSSSTPLVGMMMRHCEGNKRLTIFMDCEDSSNKTRATYPKFVGPILNQTAPYEIVGAGNILMYFCIVPRSAFYPIKNQTYGVLQVTNENEAMTLIHHMDNEDSKNTNYAYCDDQKISSLGSNIFNHNTTLVWTIISDPSGNSQRTSIPAINCCVLGKFGYELNDTNRHGYLYSDDEDSNNKNSATIIKKINFNGSWTTLEQSNIKGNWYMDLIKVSKNTEFNFTKFGNINASL